MWAYRSIKAGRYGPVEARRGGWSYVSLSRVEAVEVTTFTTSQLVQAGIPLSRAHPNPAVSQPAAIYVIEHPLGFVKIGQSAALKVQFDFFNSASPIPLKLVHVQKTSDALAAERRIHKRLKPARVRPDLVRSEWFKIKTKTALKIVKAECRAADVEYAAAVAAAAEQCRLAERYKPQELANARHS